MAREPKLTTTTTPAAAPAEPNPDRYGVSLAAQFMRVEGQHQNSKEDTAFLGDLLREWNAGNYSLAKATVICGARALKIAWLPDAVIDHNEELAPLGLMFDELVAGSSVGRFLDTLARVLANGHADLETILLIVQNEMSEWQARLDTAREVLEQNPRAMRHEIRAAVKKHPELVAE